MKRSGWIPGILLIFCAVGLCAAADDSDVIGAWRIAGTDERGNARSAVLYINEQPDGSLGGRWNTGAGSVELREVRYKDGTLAFWWYVDIQRTLIKLHFRATVDGDRFEGKLTEPHAVGDVTGTRIKVKPKEEPAASD